MPTKYAVPEPLLPLPKESDDAHLAFLIYGIMKPRRGNLTILSKHIRRGASTLRFWRKNYLWKTRLQAFDATAVELECMQAYYIYANSTHGEDFLGGLSEYIRVPYPADFGDLFTPYKNRTKKKDPDADNTNPRQLVDAAKNAVESEHKTHKDRTEKILELTDLSLEYYADSLSKGKVRVSARDLLTLAKTASMIHEDVMGHESPGGPVLIESVRMKQARASGANILEACLEDAEELVVILMHLLRPAHGTGTATKDTLDNVTEMRLAMKVGAGQEQEEEKSSG